jgi:hypothetical protein
MMLEENRWYVYKTYIATADGNENENFKMHI